MQAQQSLSNISGNRDLWIAEYRKELAERDYRSGLEAAENKGLERGRSEGISIGEKRTISLVAKFFEAGREEDLKRAMSDNTYLQQLLKEHQS